MKLTDVKDRVRRMHWPEPSPDLRARVLSREPIAERPITWAAPVASPGERPSQLDHAETSRHADHGWRRSGVLIALSVLLIAGSCAGFDVVEGNRVNAVVARIEAKYGSLDLSTLTVPAVPPADNRARVVRSAAALVVPLPGVKYHYLDYQLPAPVPQGLRAFAESNADAIRAVDGVRTRRQSNWEIDYPARTHYLPFDSIRILSDAIFLTAVMDLEAGRSDEATRMAVTGLGISASLRQEPDAVSQSLRVGYVGGRQIHAIREIVTRGSPSAGALEELASSLAENRTPDPALVFLLGELKEQNAILARMENGDIDPNVAGYIYPMTWPSWPMVLLRPAARLGRPFVRQARVRSLEYTERLLDLLAGPLPHPRLPEFPAPQRWELVDRLAEKFASPLGWEAGMGDSFLRTLGRAQVGVALRRFKIDHGAYPDDPAALVPRYLPALPMDPATGRPPNYVRQGDGFALLAPEIDAIVRQNFEWHVPK